LTLIRFPLMKVESSLRVASDVGLHAVESDLVSDLTNRVEYVANSSSAPAHVVEILAVAPWAIEPELVEARAPAEHEFVSQ
jgi:hypothetical protein